MTSPATAAVASTGTSDPSVLALIVVGPGAWPSLRDCLLSVAHQSYPRVGVLAVDDGADPEVREMLHGSLGSRRVLKNEERLGIRPFRARGARSSGRESRGLRSDHRSARGARQGCGRSPRRSRDRDRRRERRDRRRQDRGSGSSALAAGHRPLVGSIRPSVVVSPARRDRSGTVRSCPRGDVRFVGGDVDRARCARSNGPVRRAARS